MSDEAVGRAAPATPAAGGHGYAVGAGTWNAADLGTRRVANVATGLAADGTGGTATDF